MGRLLLERQMHPPFFTFNLTNSIAAAGFPSTFLNVDWTQNATENCSDGTF